MGYMEPPPRPTRVFSDFSDYDIIERGSMTVEAIPSHAIVPADAVILSDGSDPTVPFYAVAEPAWWRWRARRTWRARWPKGFD